MNTHDELRSKPDYESDPVEQLAFELAFELEDADLSPNDYVTVNREKLRAIARRILERLSRERGTVPEGWQDISTAPKDGTWFLICRDDEGFDSYEIGCYEPLTHDRFEPAEGGLYRKVPVKILDHRGFNNFHRATHWMPLPAPPAVKEGEGV
jgi:hypothetical protein